MQEQKSLFKEYKGIFDEVESAFTKERKAVAKTNPFALADAFGKNSPKESWIEYIKARNSGLEPELLCSTLASKARDMLLSQMTSSEALQIHPFVYKKAKADFKNWQKEKLQSVYDKLVFAYHDARITGIDLDVEVEKILLNL